MDLADMTMKERMKWKRLRRDFLNGIACKYHSLEDFFFAEEANLAVMGYAASLCSEYASATIFLDYDEYEEYYIVPGEDGQLRVSDIIMWQDECCANSYNYIGNRHLREDRKLIEGCGEKIEELQIEEKLSQIRRIPHKFYPKKLLAIGDDCPKEMYILGFRWLLMRESEPLVAIIGSRECDEKGRILAYKLAQKAAQEGKVVVSGLASGIDTSAHLGCLDAGGDTIAVVGSGLDIVHPKENAWLQERIKRNTGAIVSEQPPGTKANPSRLNARCRIQAALADEVIVVECGNPSGTLHTVEFARKYGKPVYAVKYDEITPQNAGNHYLLENGLAQPLDIENL